MAESSQGRSINLGSDQVSKHYCQSCFDVNSANKHVAGYCVDCQESLCLDCYTSHLLPKPSRNHRLVDKSTKPKSKLHPKRQHKVTREKCPRHHGKTLQSFCGNHSQLCCTVCLTINHKTCQTEDISKLARNIKSSAELKDLNKQLGMLKQDYNETLSKTDTMKPILQMTYSGAIDEIKNLRDEFERKMAETEKQVELVKVELLNKLEAVADTCNVVIEEINHMTSRLETLQNEGDNERVFISIKRGELELHSMAESLTKLKSDNTVGEHKFEPNAKLKTLLSESNVLGCLSGCPSTHIEDPAIKSVSISQQMSKKSTHVKDITISTSQLFMHGTVTMSNKQILIADSDKKVKLIDIENGTLVSDTRLSDTPNDITKVSAVQFAVTLPDRNKIQIISLKQNILSIERQIKVKGKCYGIAYNDESQTFIVSYCDPGKVEIITMTGTVLRIIKTNPYGSELFVSPQHVALDPDMSVIYVSDYCNDSVTLLTMYGDVKIVYKNVLKHPAGKCVHKSGLMYVVNRGSHTVQQMDPRSFEFKLLLDKNDGLDTPWSISYCDVEDKIYVGNFYDKHLKVFEMK